MSHFPTEGYHDNWSVCFSEMRLVFFFLAALGFELRTSHLLGNHHVCLSDLLGV
jgi:hypothetical protein